MRDCWWRDSNVRTMRDDELVDLVDKLDFLAHSGFELEDPEELALVGARLHRALCEVERRCVQLQLF